MRKAGLSNPFRSDPFKGVRRAPVSAFVGMAPAGGARKTPSRHCCTSRDRVTETCPDPAPATRHPSWRRLPQALVPRRPHFVWRRNFSRGFRPWRSHRTAPAGSIRAGTWYAVWRCTRGFLRMPVWTNGLQPAWPKLRHRQSRSNGADGVRGAAITAITACRRPRPRHVGRAAGRRSVWPWVCCLCSRWAG